MNFFDRYSLYGYHLENTFMGDVQLIFLWISSDGDGVVFLHGFMGKLGMMGRGDGTGASWGFAEDFLCWLVVTGCHFWFIFPEILGMSNHPK